MNLAARAFSRTFLMTLVILFAGSNSFAQESEKPTAEEAKKFLDYYYKGQGSGPILVEKKLCSDIHKEGENKNECTEVISTMKVKESGLIWMLFSAPSNDKYENIIIQFKRGELVRSARKVSITGSLRYRVWTRFKPDKAGDWMIKVVNEKSDGSVDTLGELSMKVTE